MGPSDHDKNDPLGGASAGDHGPTHANGEPPGGGGWLRAVLENSSEVIKIVDVDGTLRYASPAFGRVFGHEPGEVVGRMNVLDYVHPEDLPRVLEETERATSAGGTVSNRVEYRFRHADGSWRWVESVGTYLPDDPAVRGVVVSVRDITGRKEAEEALRDSEAEVFSILESITDGFFVLDHELRFSYVNPQAALMLGRSREDLVGERIWEDPAFYPEYRRAVAEGRTVRFEGYYPPSGAWYSVRAYPSASGLSVYFQDVTERKEAGEALKRSEERYRSLVERIPPIIYIQTPREGETAAYDTTYMSPRVEEVLGYPPQRFTGDPGFWDGLIHPEDLGVVREENERTDRTGEPFFIEYRVTAQDGRLTWLRDEAVLVRGSAGNPLYWHGVISDVTERKALEARLEHRALHDPLTGLPNRRLFVDRLAHALEVSRRGEGHVTVLFMDLDAFKVVNDSLGHEVGDLLLMVVAQRLGRCLRDEDTLARFGGDEFVVLMEDVGDPSEAIKVVERITEELRRPFALEGQELYVSASAGISFGNARTNSPEGLLRDADTAMYRAKEEGGGYRVFDPAMHERAVLRLALENDLRRAIERGEFVVHYQPIVRLDDRSVWGVEALARWRHPERGLLNPDEFVPIAEESGLVVPMGLAVLEEACRRAKGWQEAHPKLPPLVVYVNLSARQIARPDLAEAVGGALGRTDFDGSCLGLDVTERVYVKALEGDFGGLDRLRDLGVRVSIDDFGTGYSSLSYLKRLPADDLKVDKSFVRGLGEDAEDTAIVRTVVELAHTLGLEAIAEGVETEEQAALLTGMGCDKAQGYHFSRPLPPEDVPGFLGG